MCAFSSKYQTIKKRIPLWGGNTIYDTDTNFIYFKRIHTAFQSFVVISLQHSTPCIFCIRKTRLPQAFIAHLTSWSMLCLHVYFIRHCVKLRLSRSLKNFSFRNIRESLRLQIFICWAFSDENTMFNFFGCGSFFNFQSVGETKLNKWLRSLFF